MTTYKYQDSPSTALLKKLNAMRKDRVLYDVSLIVGDQTVPAHKNILVACSDYFRSLFVGPLGNNSQTEVDLTHITTDSNAVETMVDYLYTNEFMINPINLEPLLKLSSFLLMSDIRDDCVLYMEDPHEHDACLSLLLCLKYYMLSVEHSLEELEKRLKPIVTSRFHDCLIFQENSLEIKPAQFLHLKDIQALQHCSVKNLLNFTVDWVRIGDTKEHISVGYDILEYICAQDMAFREDLAQAEDIKLLMKLREKVESSITDSKFSLKVCETIDSLMGSSSTKQHKRKLRSQQVKGNGFSKPDTSELSDDISNNSAVEEIFLAVSTRNPVKEKIANTEFGEYIGKCEVDEDKKLFDMCMYVPKTKKWHLLQTFTRDMDKNESFSIDEAVNATESAIKDIPPYALKNFNWYEVDSVICTQDKLSCVFHNCYLGLCNMSKLTWDVISLDNSDLYWEEKDGVLEKFGFGEPDSKQILVRGPSESLYILMEENTYVDYEWSDYTCTEASWRIYKLTPDNKLLHITGTDMITVDKAWENEEFTCGLVIPESNEMIIAHHNRYLHVFAVVLGGEKEPASVTSLTPDYESPYVKVAPEYEKRWPHWLDVAILRDESQCYFVEIDTKEDGPIKFVCRFKYVYKSKILTPCEVSEFSVENNSSKEPLKSDAGCKFRLNSSDEKSIWVFGGNKDKATTLQEVQFDGTQWSVKTHTPPPFSCIAMGTTGKISRVSVKAAKPIEQFIDSCTLCKPPL